MPYNRCLMALTLMRGDKVDNWVQQQLTHLEQQLAGGIRQPNEEAFWTDLRDAFRAAFTNTSKKENAVNKLGRLAMQGSDLDTYTADFENLRTQAGWERDAQGTILMWRQGLKPALHRMIIQIEHP